MNPFQPSPPHRDPLPTRPHPTGSYRILRSLMNFHPPHPTGSYRGSYDRPGAEERHVGRAAELSPSNQLDAEVGEDL